MHALYNINIGKIELYRCISSTNILNNTITMRHTFIYTLTAFALKTADYNKKN